MINLSVVVVGVLHLDIYTRHCLPSLPSNSAAQNVKLWCSAGMFLHNYLKSTSFLR